MMIGRDMRLLNNASNSVNGKNKAIMETRLKNLLD